MQHTYYFFLSTTKQELECRPYYTARLFVFHFFRPAPLSRTNGIFVDGHSS